MTDISKQLIEQVSDAVDKGASLAITGGNSKSFMGRQTTADSSLDVSGHSGIVDYQPVELVMTARAGTRLSELEAELAANNQMLAFEPPHFSEDSTIGGTLACNQSGPGRPWQGSVRDHVLGVRLINGMGEHLRFGGQVMKNVAGYDVSRLQAGAMGTLGVLTEISLKVLPKPDITRTITFEVGADEAITLMNERAGQPKPLSAACWLDGTLYLRLSGAASAVEATMRQWGGELLDDDVGFWRNLRDQKLAFFAGDKPLWRFSQNSTAPLESLEGEWLLDWGGAQRWYRGNSELTESAELSKFAGLAEQAGGQACCFRGGDRSGEVMHQPAKAMRELQQRVKQSLDPKGIFNPGRLHSWL